MTIELSLWDLAGAAALVLVNGMLSIWLRLGLERQLLVASVRTVVQLLLLGYLLKPVFAIGHWGLVVVLALMMMVVAGHAAASRSTRRYDGSWMVGIAAMAAGALPTTLFATAVLIGVEPFWLPQYFVPLLGMILGNALTGVSLGIDRTLAQLDEGRGGVELMLAMGATRAEATRPIVAESLRTGLIPILNKMSVVGLVAIPGMMTGQILGGAPPDVAARYQILILFLIAGAIGLGTLFAVLWSVRAVFDEMDRLRPERIRRAPKKKKTG